MNKINYHHPPLMGESLCAVSFLLQSSAPDLLEGG